ncbi:SOS response-associated peptidase [Shewanella sp. D64]|uniref:SOS response-associated peptidase family protein n=1 Tax=unclassified Shewanella TaxID=196818 RepID=UPI0022BA6D8F|nr:MULTISPECIES: SOS response-associated peptidase family protein [unclassified Shewanella]MEC4726821.1 SOS response-associated peptidase [Shewanella sp. D64]MEC4739067.1 SOS response-associated peptidase [Shewanella sp. E94]WBJ95923.1 SOS response-associated peptidase [Shewanella sp. MTB7]
MCGRLNMIDDLFMRTLMQDLGVSNPNEMNFNRFKMPTNEISIVREQDGVRRLQPAIWWLLQEISYEGFKPSKYTSFNTRYDKLNQIGSASYLPFREHRCIILAKGFGETEKRGRSVEYYDFIAQDSAISLGGLFQEWHHPKTGEYKVSCSIITNPPHPDMEEFHSKASPLILPQSSAIQDAWLDPHNHQVNIFEHLLKPALRHNFLVQQIEKPSSYKKIGEAQLLRPYDD